MIRIIEIVCIKKRLSRCAVLARVSKHCVTNMVADEEAVISAVITAIFLVNKEEKKNKEIVYNREIVYKGEETHASNYGLCRRYCSSISTTCLQRELSPVSKYI